MAVEETSEPAPEQVMDTALDAARGSGGVGPPDDPAS
jgi:hypothetical protein